MSRSRLQNSQISLASLTIALFATIGPGHAQYQTPSEGAQLWAAGPRQFGPVPYALIQAEALTEQEQAAFRQASRDRMRDEAKRVEQLRDAAGPAKVSQAERSQAADNLIDTLRVAHQRMVLDKRQAEDAGVAANIILAGAGLATGGATGAALTLAGPALSDKFNRGVQDLSGYEKDYKAAVNNAVELALLRTDPAVRAKWTKQGITDANREVAANELFGDSNQFFQDGMGKALPQELRAELAGIQTGILKKGIETVAARQARGEKDLEAFKKSAGDQFEAQKQRTTQLVSQVQTLRKAVANQVEAIDLLARNTATQMQRLDAKIAGLDDQARATQNAMLRQMSPRDRLMALEDPAFLRPKTAEEAAQRAIEVQSLRRFDRVMTTRDSLSDGLDGIGQAAGFAVAIGIPIDTYNLNRNIATAKAGINLVASLATGNYFGALSSMGGLFGGGGGQDGTTAALAEISGKLDKVMALQRETLQRIQDLSDKIDRNQIEIMSTLRRMEEKIDHANAMAANEKAKPYAACRGFLNIAREKKIEIKSGVYPTYRKRIEHFEADQLAVGQSRAADCYQWLQDVIVPGEPMPGQTVFEPAFVMRAVTWEASDIGSPNSTKGIFDAMWTAHVAMLGWGTVGPGGSVGSIKENCVKRAAGFLAMAPTRVGSLRDERFACTPEKEDIPAGRWLRDTAGRDVGSSELSKHIISSQLANHLGEMILFITPFFELAIQAPGDKLRLPLPKELLSGAAGKDPKRLANAARAVAMTASYPDQINLAIAQETVMSGTALAPVLAKTLMAHAFGANLPATSRGSIKKDLAAADGQDEAGIAAADRKHCAVTSRSWTSAPYLAAACLVSNNPLLARNVGRMIAAEQLDGKGNSRLTIAQAYLASEAWMKDLMPAVTTLKRSDPANKLSWTWSYQEPGIATRTILFPMASELTSGFLEQSLPVARLVELRGRFDIRNQANAADALLSAAGRASAGGSEGAKGPIDEAAARISAMTPRARETARWALTNGARAESQLIETSIGTW
ncbi:hypothetical protein [Bosea sp. RAC05]|uniref:hypothetical protein n=1 Tax=Bosea sp. RAC05 TaxID=1842539 RepID=UPI00083D14F1|nr:hypothetical protein [Bosea sp. RAC05]AOG03034.1 hypothetical protein BSY19_4927 [Bosea sp. RAC05]